MQTAAIIIFIGDEPLHPHSQSFILLFDESIIASVPNHHIPFTYDR